MSTMQMAVKWHCNVHTLHLSPYASIAMACCSAAQPPHTQYTDFTIFIVA